MPPIAFLENLVGFLLQLAPGKKLGVWKFVEIDTQTSYSDATGHKPDPKEFPGYVFQKDEKEYIIRPYISRAHLSIDAKHKHSRLIEHQLNKNKYIYDDQRVKIVEAYAMTSFRGKIPKHSVKEAMEKVGFEGGDAIVEFNSEGADFDLVVEKILNWAEFRESAKALIKGEHGTENHKVSISEIGTDDSSEITGEYDYDIDSYRGKEGREIFLQHLAKERNRTLITKFKKWLARTRGELKCEVCEMSFEKVYGKNLGSAFIEAHHKTPIKDLDGEVETTFNDLAAVCSNCHRMLHQGERLLTVEELRSIVIVNRHLH